MPKKSLHRTVVLLLLTLLSFFSLAMTTCDDSHVEQQVPEPTLSSQEAAALATSNALYQQGGTK